MARNGARPELRGLTAIAELAQMVDAAEDSNSAIELRERMAEIELGLEDLGWYRIGYETQAQLSRQGLRRLTTVCRMLYLKHPLINHAVDIATHYVWGQGVAMTAKSDEINTLVQSWWDLKDNRREITGHRARMLKERELRLAGNVFLVLFTDPVRGTVRCSSIEPTEVEDIICNPQNRREVWYYHRRYNEAERFDLDTGVSVGSHPVDEYYPDWQYNPAQKPPRIAGKPVMWTSPVYHIKAGGLDNMLFGVPEIFSAIDWARAVQSDLENYATVRKALARFAWVLTMKGTPGGFNAARQRLESTIGAMSGSSNETQPPPVAGSTLLQKKDAADMQPIRTAGMQPPPEEGRRLGLMAGAGLGIPETMLWGDATLGNYATAKSLDRPTELSFMTRQQDWIDTFIDLTGYVIDAAARATKGPLRMKLLVDSYSGEQTVQVLAKGGDTRGQPLDRRVDVAFPSILEHDQLQSVQAIATAATLDGKALAGLVDSKTLARLLLVALGVNNIDEVLAITHPDEPNPPPAAPATTPPAAPAVEPPAPTAPGAAPAAESSANDANVAAVRELRERVDALTAELGAARSETQLVEKLIEITSARDESIKQMAEAVLSRPTEVHHHEARPARRVKRTKSFHENERGHITGSTEVEEADDEPAYSMPDGSYPINTCADVSDAAKMAHHSGKYSFEDVRAMVMRAKSGLGCSDDVLPDTWEEALE